MGKTKEELLTDILRITDAFGFDEDIMPGYLYSKVLYLAEELKPLLSDDETMLFMRHGVQRGVAFIAGRPDDRGIPDECYAVHNGQIVSIRKDINELTLHTVKTVGFLSD